MMAEAAAPRAKGRPEREWLPPGGKARSAKGAPIDPGDDGVVLRVAGLRKSYGDSEVVRGLDFSIRRGECFGLLGPNGAGKTTTLRCCLGLTDPCLLYTSPSPRD